MIKNPAFIKNIKNQTTVWSFIKIALGYYKGAYTGIIYIPIRNISKMFSRCLLFDYLHFGGITFLCKSFVQKQVLLKSQPLKKKKIKLLLYLI